MKIIAGLFILFFASVCISASQSLPQRKLLVGNAVLMVEIAEKWDTRSRGLMFRDSLDWDKGMLFIYHREQILEFWMKNTLIDLDIGFFDRERILRKIKTMKKLDETPVSSEVPVMYALEVNKGWFKARGIAEGVKFNLH